MDFNNFGHNSSFDRNTVVICTYVSYIMSHLVSYWALCQAIIEVSEIGHNVTSNQLGHYWRLLPPGTYNIRASAYGYEPSVVITVQVDATTGRKEEPLGTIHILRKHFYSTKLNLTTYLFFHKNLRISLFLYCILTKFSCCSLKFLVQKQHAQKNRENVVVDKKCSRNM